MSSLVKMVIAAVAGLLGILVGIGVWRTRGMPDDPKLGTVKNTFNHIKTGLDPRKEARLTCMQLKAANLADKLTKLSNSLKASQ
jgi:hypothetical protein